MICTLLKYKILIVLNPLGNPGSVFRKEEQVNLLQEEDVLKIAQKHGVTAGQTLIRYQVDKGNIGLREISSSGNLIMKITHPWNVCLCE